MKKTYQPPTLTDIHITPLTTLLLPASDGRTTDENLSRTNDEMEEEMEGGGVRRPRYDCWEEEEEEEL